MRSFNIPLVAFLLLTHGCLCANRGGRQGHRNTDVEPQVPRPHLEQRQEAYWEKDGPADDPEYPPSKTRDIDALDALGGMVHSYFWDLEQDIDRFEDPDAEALVNPGYWGQQIPTDGQGPLQIWVYHRSSANPEALPSNLEIIGGIPVADYFADRIANRDPSGQVRLNLGEGNIFTVGYVTFRPTPDAKKEAEGSNF
ncbi:MAG: hypothetical protein M1837_006565 [Sclerophora amabilis]|nr:MAG: hypothetical protein M1837_006565 [Sclerophora amabilis]